MVLSDCEAFLSNTFREKEAKKRGKKKFFLEQLLPHPMRKLQKKNRNNSYHRLKSISLSFQENLELQVKAITKNKTK